MVMIDAIVRLIPGVLGNFDSAENDSFQNGLLGYPHYTKPQVFHGKKVPDVLISGNHKQIEEWRRKKALEVTLQRRPDMLAQADLTQKEVKFIEELKTQVRKG